MKARVNLFNSSAVRQRCLGRSRERASLTSSSHSFPLVTWSFFPRVTEAPTKFAFTKLLRNEKVSPGQADRGSTMRQRGKQRHRECKGKALSVPQTYPSLESVYTKAEWEGAPTQLKGDWKPSPEKGHELQGQMPS